YAVESLTDEIEAAARALMGTVEEMGGAVAAIERGFQKSEIEQSAYAVSLGIDSGSRVVVGVNKWAAADEEHYEPLRVNPAIEAEQRERLRVLRAERDGDLVAKLLDDIRTAASGTANVLYPVKEALRARATVGEVCHALRDVWGTYRPHDSF
ncbi:MAG TPA: methylmalonyl-CoA mutase family protein, partial [Mycobacteriales bacterium]|nr:methylmalonyl-CoA mutase family protein [Mycobacteriales bacterium]